MPNSEDFNSLHFRTCCDLYGGVRSLTCGRRNGHPFIFLSGDFHRPMEPTIPARSLDEEHRLFVNLNPRERQTWRKILAAQPIASIAKEEGVSRAAIYSRIQGNSKGQGGMIGKNVWVLLWWRLRQRMTAGGQ